MRTRKREPNPKPVIKFGDLKIGEVFSFEHRLHMKVRLCVDETKVHTTAIVLSSGTECFVPPQTRITLVDGEYVYED